MLRCTLTSAAGYASCLLAMILVPIRVRLSYSVFTLMRLAASAPQTFPGHAIQYRGVGQLRILVLPHCSGSRKAASVSLVRDAAVSSATGIAIYAAR